MAEQCHKTPHLTTKRLHWNAKDKAFSAELSDLTEEVGRMPRFKQVYPDACDVGLCIASHVTGKLAWWYLADTVRDAEGDLQYFKLKPTSEATKEFPALAGAEMILFND